MNEGPKNGPNYDTGRHPVYPLSTTKATCSPATTTCGLSVLYGRLTHKRVAEPANNVGGTMSRKSRFWKSIRYRLKKTILKDYSEDRKITLPNRSMFCYYLPCEGIERLMIVLLTVASCVMFQVQVRETVGDGGYRAELYRGRDRSREGLRGLRGHQHQVRLETTSHSCRILECLSLFLFLFLPVLFLVGSRRPAVFALHAAANWRENSVHHERYLCSTVQYR